VVETSSVGTIEDALADSMMTVVVVAEVVAADGGVAGAAADLMTTIATIANNIGATTASAVSIAGGGAFEAVPGIDPRGPAPVAASARVLPSVLL
jgi:hypothetical protein